MKKQFEAVYQGGVLRLLEPLDLRENQQVTLTFAAETALDDWLDTDYLRFCEEQADDRVTLAAVRQSLAKIPGSLTPDFMAEREDRC